MKYKFSIISAVYNSEKFLNEMIDSIIGQDIDFENNVQLILVDDGSSDSSGEICDKYAKQYPNNIISLRKENGGVSSARNAGIPYASGEYWNFMDSDDKLALDALSKVYEYFCELKDEVDVVNIPFEYIGTASGGENHPQNRKFKGGKRVVDLEKEPNIMIMNVTYSFMSAQAARDIFFDTEICIAEDLKFINTILLKKRKVALLPSTKYYYRKHDSSHTSLISSKELRKEYYIPLVKNLILWAPNYCMEKYNEYPMFMQYVITSVLEQKIRQRYNYRKVLSKEEIKLHAKLMNEALLTIDDSVIMNYSDIPKAYRYYWLVKKHGFPTSVESYENKVVFSFGEQSIEWYGFASVNNISIKNNFAKIEACVTVFPSGKVNPTIYVSANDELYAVTLSNFSDELINVIGDKIYNLVHFKVEIPLGEKTKIKFAYTFPNCNPSEIQFVGYGPFSPITTESKINMFYDGGYAAYANKNGITAEHIKKRLYKKIYRRKLLSLLKVSKKKFLARFIADIFLKFKKKEIWLISDREKIANDNGEALFTYLCKNPCKSRKVYFIIDKNSTDYERISKIGKAIPAGSFWHKVMYLICDKNISAHFDGSILRPVDPFTYRDYEAKIQNIFLQHGVTKDDVSAIYSKFKDNISMFVCAGKPEAKSVISNQAYGFEPEDVVLTGFPRFDLLESNPKKIITVLPTWRKSMFSGYDDAGRKWILRKDFKESDFFKHYHSLLNDTRLIDMLEKHGYTLNVCAHLNTSEIFGNMDFDSRVTIEKDSIDYKQIFSESSLLITDYSSVAFDFAFLNKPVIYYQFDKDTFFETHTYKKGYFDYERDGFGEVVCDEESISSLLCSYIEKNCKINEKYAKRVDDFFAFRDKDNCRRVTEAIVCKSK